VPDSVLYQYAYETDGTPRFLHISRGVEQLNGVRVEDVLRDPGTMLRQIPPENLEQLIQAEKRSARELTDFDVEVPMRRPDGQVRWVRLRSRPQRMPDGRVIWDGVETDISERKRVEADLRASEERFKKAFESSPAALVITRLEDGKILEANEGFAKLVGYGREELIGLRSVEAGLIGGEERAALAAQVSQTGKVEQEEVVLHNRDGQSRRVLASAEGMRLRGEECVVWTGLDITDRKRAEEGLARLAAIVEWSDDAIVSRTLDGVIQTWNAGAERMFGYRAEEVIGRPVTLLIPPERVHEEARVLAQLRRGQPVEHYETVRLTKDGRRIDVSLTISPVRDSQGRVIGASKIARDIGDIVRARGVLASGKQELEWLVAERTARLQEMVGELEHFSYTITHDLKSPLRAMRGFAEMASLMCGDGVGEEVRELLGKISTAAERMDGLIADALNYSRSVRQELPLEDVDAGALLRGMLDSYPELQPDRARIVVEGRLPVVLANKAGLTQCFSNLLGNAVKFVGVGEKPEIRVWADQVPAHGHRSEWMRISVEDKGIGISKEMLPRVFDMFSRGSKDYAGTGIGLALVRKVAQRMGGRVGVESEEGRGSRFWIELGRGEAQAFADATARQVERVGAGEGTVLYVEDEESDAMFMERAFAEKGLAGKLRLVGTGRAAIDYLSGAGEFGDRGKYPVPGLVLLDLNLPQVSGFGVLEWIRNNPDYARLPVVVFSSSTREDDRVKARELGADEFVAKPSSGMKFGEVVERLQQRWGGRANGEA
jgi:PAS domain S-box-containing protein